MSHKEFELILQMIALLLKEGKTDEVLQIIEKYVGEIGAEPETKKAPLKTSRSAVTA